MYRLKKYSLALLSVLIMLIGSYAGAETGDCVFGSDVKAYKDGREVDNANFGACVTNCSYAKCIECPGDTGCDQGLLNGKTFCKCTPSGKTVGGS